MSIRSSHTEDLDQSKKKNNLSDMGKSSTVACNFCKRRKIKCNRERPCGSCIRYRSNCSYPERTLFDKPSALKIIESLSVRLDQIEDKVLEQYHIPEDNFQQDRNKAPQLWKDIDLNGLVDPEADEDDKFVLFDTASKIINGKYFPPLSYEALINGDDEVAKVWQSMMHDSQFSWFYYNRVPMPLDLNFSYFPGVGGAVQSDETMLLRKVVSKLPRYADIWKLVGFFFRRVYPFIAIIDEFEFRKEIRNILGETAEEIGIRDKTSLIYLGQLLMIMRFSYVNDESLPLVDHIVVDLAVQCINHYDLIRYNNLSFLQLIMLVRSYQIHAPDHGEALDFSVSNSLSSLALQKAYALGLHREPWDGLSVDGPKNNLRRKLWFHMLINDFLSTFMIGGPTNVTRFDYTTGVPYCNGENFNNGDIDLESLSVSAFSMFANTSQYVLQYFKILQSPSVPFSIPRMKETMSSSVDSYFDAQSSFAKFLDRADDLEHYYAKSFKIKFFLQNCSFLLRTNFHFLHHYHRIGNKSKTQESLKDILHTIYVDLLQVLQVLMTDALVCNNEKVCKTFLYPPVQSVVSTIVIIHLSVLTKTTGSTHELMKKGFQLFMDFLKVLSQKCFYSWRMFKLHSFVYERLLLESRTSEFNLPVVYDVVSLALGTLELCHFLKDFSVDIDEDLWSHVSMLKKVTTK